MAELKLAGLGLRSYGDVIFHTDGAYDVGKPGATRPRNIYFTNAVIGTAAFATPSALSATQFTAFASTVSGATLMGYGTTGDVTLKNRAGTTVAYVGPNTTKFWLVGALEVAGAASFTTGAFSNSVTLTTTGNTGFITIGDQGFFVLRNASVTNVAMLSTIKGWRGDGAGSVADAALGVMTDLYVYRNNSLTASLSLTSAGFTCTPNLTVGASTFVVTAATGAVSATSLTLDSGVGVAAVKLLSGGVYGNWTVNSLSMGFSTVGAYSWIQSGGAATGAPLHLNEYAGNVGIGMDGTTPTALLHVNGSLTAGAASFTTGAFSGKVTISGSTSSQLDVTTSSTGYAAYFKGGATASNSYGLRIDAGTNASDIAFTVLNKAADAIYFTITGAGAVSIPTGNLTVGASTFVVTAATGATSISGTITNNDIISGLAAGSIRISGSSASGFGGVVNLYGHTHATKAGVVEFLASGGVTMNSALAITGALTGVTTAELTGNLSIKANASALFYNTANDNYASLAVLGGAGTSVLTISSSQVTVSALAILGKAFVFGANDSAGAGYRTVVLTNA
jgi:hypothetical protein